MLPPLLLLPAAAAVTTLAAAASAPRSVVLHVAPGAAGGSSCTNATSAHDDFTCPTLPAALALAATLDNANSTVVFAGTQAVREPLQLRSAAPPASLRLLGGAGAVIDGGGSSALLQVSGSGAVTVESVGFRRGFVSFGKGAKGYAPVGVGFPKPMASPTTFTDCSFIDNVGACKQLDRVCSADCRPLWLTRTSQPASQPCRYIICRVVSDPTD